MRAAVEDLGGFGLQWGVQLEFSEPAEECMCVSNSERLQQIIANVVSNAVKFSAKGDVVKIATSVNGAFAEIRITDTGPGIPEGSEEKVFGRFTQLDSSTSRAHEGTGLGMTIAKLMIEQMNGSIYYRSKVGVGTTFCLRVPLAEPEAAMAAA